MNRVQKTIYTDDKGRELISLKNGKATIETYYDYTADDLDQLSNCCAAAAEELRSLAERKAVEAEQ